MIVNRIQGLGGPKTGFCAAETGSECGTGATLSLQPLFKQTEKWIPAEIRQGLSSHACDPCAIGRCRMCV